MATIILNLLPQYAQYIFVMCHVWGSAINKSFIIKLHYTLHLNYNNNRAKDTTVTAIILQYSQCDTAASHTFLRFFLFVFLFI